MCAQKDSIGRRRRARWRRRGACSVTAAVVALFVAPAAQAGFSVSPATANIKVKRDAAATGSFRVTLKGERGRRFRVDVEDVLQTRAGGFQFRRATAGPFSASRWISVAPRTFSGAPNRTQAVEFSVRVPPLAEPGDHIAALTVKRLAPDDRSGAATVQALAFRVTVRVPGEVRERVAIDSLEAPAIVGGGTVSVSALIRNTGTVRLDFDRLHRGRVAILDGDRVKGSLPLRGTLLPGGVRRFQLDLDEPPPVGKLEAEATVRAGGRVERRSSGIWVVPWRQGGALLLVGVAVLVVFMGRRVRPRAGPL